MTIEWIKETTELIEELEKRKQDLDEKIQQLVSESDDLQTQIIAGHELIKVYMTKHNVESITPENYKLSADKSYPKALIDIAQSSNGILNISDAINILVKANVGGNRETIQHNVYNAMRRLRGHFVQIQRGQYRFTNHIQDNVKKKQKVKRKEPSGVREAVKEIKTQNPLWTLQEVLSYLKKNNFDFKGKKPSSAVNMAWVNLGYSKEGKQQALPIISIQGIPKSSEDKLSVGVPSAHGIVSAQ